MSSCLQLETRYNKLHQILGVLAKVFRIILKFIKIGAIKVARYTGIRKKLQLCFTSNRCEVPLMTPRSFREYNDF
jgi:hypothetical protein